MCARIVVRVWLCLHVRGWRVLMVPAWGLQEVHKAACAALTAVFFNCLTKDFVEACAAAGGATPLHRVVGVLGTIVQYKYQVRRLGTLWRGPGWAARVRTRA
jgi:hypothetical protein